MYQNIPTKVLTGEVRLSYANLSQPRASQPGDEPKYSVMLLIPKTDVATKADIDASIRAAYENGVVNVWGGVRPTIPDIIHDGDGVKPNSGTPYGDECKGCWVVTASSKNKPGVVDITNVKCELAPNDIYSGMYARVTINFYPYKNRKTGVGCGLGNVLKTREGEPLGGGASAEADFVGIAPAPSTQTYAPAQAYTAPFAQIYTAPAQNINPVTGMPM